MKNGLLFVFMAFMTVAMMFTAVPAHALFGWDAPGECDPDVSCVTDDAPAPVEAPPPVVQQQAPPPVVQQQAPPVVHRPPAEQVSQVSDDVAILATIIDENMTKTTTAIANNTAAIANNTAAIASNAMIINSLTNNAAIQANINEAIAKKMATLETALERAMTLYNGASPEEVALLKEQVRNLETQVSRNTLKIRDVINATRGGFPSIRAMLTDMNSRVNKANGVANTANGTAKTANDTATRAVSMATTNAANIRKNEELLAGAIQKAGIINQVASDAYESANTAFWVGLSGLILAFLAIIFLVLLYKKYKSSKKMEAEIRKSNRSFSKKNADHEEPIEAEWTEASDDPSGHTA